MTTKRAFGILTPESEPFHEAYPISNIDNATNNNTFFRDVQLTTSKMQLVFMSLIPQEEIGNEVHEKVDQFFRIVKGRARFVLENGKYSYDMVGPGDVVIVPAGTYHNVINISKTRSLKLYTIYTPPNHPDGTIHKTKAEAEAQEKS